MTIYTTLCSTRLHIAKDHEYIGSIRSYSNKLTKFLASLFRISIVVELSGKTRSLNKKEFNILKPYLPQFNLVNLPVLDQDPAHEVMRNKISTVKTEKLTRKLINALEMRELALAKRYLGKGADPNQIFWDRGAYCGFSDRHFYSSLPNENIEFTARSFTPLSYAIYKEWDELYSFMRDLGANSLVEGKIFNVKRKATENKLSIKYTKTHTTSLDIENLTIEEIGISSPKTKGIILAKRNLKKVFFNLFRTKKQHMANIGETHSIPDAKKETFASFFASQIKVPSSMQQLILNFFKKRKLI